LIATFLLHHTTAFHATPAIFGLLPLTLLRAMVADHAAFSCCLPRFVIAVCRASALFIMLALLCPDAQPQARDGVLCAQVRMPRRSAAALSSAMSARSMRRAADKCPSSLLLHSTD